jgi:hypothetical protein
MFFLFFFTFFYCTSFCQLKDGFYTLTSYGFPYNGDGVSSYIIIKKNKFILLSYYGDLNFGLHYMGTGNFSIEKKSFILHLTNENNNPILPFLSDSLNCNFSTDTSKQSISIKLNVHPQYNPGGEATLQIETSDKTYRYNTKNDSLTIALPGNTRITLIKLLLITYDYRILPYDYHFNNLEYNYYLNDPSVVVRYADKGEFEFKIKAKRPDGFLFEPNGSLLKTDRAVLSLKKQAVHDKNLKRIVDFLEKDSD